MILIKKAIALAERLDDLGLTKEADIIDKFALSISGNDMLSSEEYEGIKNKLISHYIDSGETEGDSLNMAEHAVSELIADLNEINN